MRISRSPLFDINLSKYQPDCLIEFTGVETEAESTQKQENRSSEHKQLKQQTTREVRRIGWSKKQAVRYIKEQYGVSDRDRGRVSSS
ncbi:MAG: hypothetical protein QNJ72_22500 [Pleurocapsa sp. MO_226.B13]|nr:hypothetical protein [Pleurocapsa sp. MO_226.B13]